VDFDPEAIARGAQRDTVWIVHLARYRVEARQWQGWSGCHLEFGGFTYAAADRDLYAPKCKGSRTDPLAAGRPRGIAGLPVSI
jgi:hypothetical protein